MGVSGSTLSVEPGVAEKHFCESKNLWSEGGRGKKSGRKLVCAFTNDVWKQRPLLNGIIAAITLFQVDNFFETVYYN
jgi:hypothetical protein